MTFYYDKVNECLIIEGISEGFEILPTSLYEGYLKKIKDLEEQNKDLQAELRYTSRKLADALSSHAENDANWHKLLRDTANSMFEVGKIRGYVHGKSGSILAVDDLLWETYEMWYAEALDNGTIAALEAKAKRRIAEKKRRRLQDHSDSQ